MDVGNAFTHNGCQKKPTLRTLHRSWGDTKISIAVHPRKLSQSLTSTIHVDSQFRSSKVHIDNTIIVENTFTRWYWRVRDRYGTGGSLDNSHFSNKSRPITTPSSLAHPSRTASVAGSRPVHTQIRHVRCQSAYGAHHKRQEEFEEQEMT